MATDPRTAIPPLDIERFRDCALELADEARNQLCVLHATAFEVKRKSDGSYVTSADVEIEQRLRAIIERRFPEHGIIGEELPARAPQAEFQWILDPIDGTEDFVQHMPTFGTIIGLHYRGEPVVGVTDVPLLDLRAHAAFGLGAFDQNGRLRLTDLAPGVSPAQTRLMLSARANFISHGDDGYRFDLVTRHYPNHRIYRSCYAHLCVARGQADAMVEHGNKLWDLAAVRILIEEAGGTYQMTQHLSTPSGPVLGAIFGKPSVVTKLLALLSEASG